MTVVKIPSASSADVEHTVRVKKAGRGFAASCSCRGYRTWHHCKHQARAIAKVQRRSK